MTEEEDKAIKDCDSIFICLDDAMSEDSANDYRKSYKILKNLIEKQSKEIEELKDMNERQKYRIELVSEDKIEERGDSIDESTMLKQIKLKLQEKNIPIETLLAEFERLEDIEDRKVQIEYNNVFNKGVKSVEDKIKAKIEYYEKIDNPVGKRVLQSLLEKE